MPAYTQVTIKLCFRQVSSVIEDEIDRASAVHLPGAGKQIKAGLCIHISIRCRWASVGQVADRISWTDNREKEKSGKWVKPVTPNLLGYWRP